MNRVLSLLVACLALASASSHGYVITGFGPHVYNANTATMNATLGVTGYRIEDFEDASLQSGFSIEYTHTGLGQLSSLPNVCPSGMVCTANDPPADVPYFRRDFPGHAWDGDHILYTPQPDNVESALVLRFLNGATSVGIGLSDYPARQLRTHAWAINGQRVGQVDETPNFFPNDTGRNLYLRIDAESGEAPITSLTFFHSAVGDALEYDHVAFLETPAKVPEPGTLALLALGLAGLGYSRRRLSLPSCR